MVLFPAQKLQSQKLYFSQRKFKLTFAFSWTPLYSFNVFKKVSQLISFRSITTQWLFNYPLLDRRQKQTRRTANTGALLIQVSCCGLHKPVWLHCYGDLKGAKNPPIHCLGIQVFRNICVSITAESLQGNPWWQWSVKGYNFNHCLTLCDDQMQTTSAAFYWIQQGVSDCWKNYRTR